MPGNHFICLSLPRRKRGWEAWVYFISFILWGAVQKAMFLRVGSFALNVSVGIKSCSRKEKKKWSKCAPFLPVWGTLFLVYVLTPTPDRRGEKEQSVTEERGACYLRWRLELSTRKELWAVTSHCGVQPRFHQLDPWVRGEPAWLYLRWGPCHWVEEIVFIGLKRLGFT